MPDWLSAMSHFFHQGCAPTTFNGDRPPRAPGGAGRSNACRRSTGARPCRWSVVVEVDQTVLWALHPQADAFRSGSASRRIRSPARSNLWRGVCSSEPLTADACTFSSIDISQRFRFCDAVIAIERCKTGGGALSGGARLPAPGDVSPHEDGL